MFEMQHQTYPAVRSAEGLALLSIQHRTTSPCQTETGSDISAFGNILLAWAFQTSLASITTATDL